MYSGLFLTVALFFLSRASAFTSFIYNTGFKPDDLALDGSTTITSNGVLRLTNETFNQKGHAFYGDPIPFKESENGSTLSFSTTFVFAMFPNGPKGGHGLVFVIAPDKAFPYSLTKEYLGMFNKTNDGNSSNHVVGVELDTNLDYQVDDIDDNHVGIDINSVKSNVSQPASYFSSSSTYVNISLSSAESMRVWVEYHGSKKEMTVTLAPIDIDKPTIPLLTLSLDLSPIFNENMYVGFSASTGSVSARQYIQGWSFALNGAAPSLDISALPKVPNSNNKKPNHLVIIVVSVIGGIVVIAAICYGVFYKIQREKQFKEEMEDWESEYGPHRFKYKDLHAATKGFDDKELLGTGGFGKVYKGLIRTSNVQVAVKRVSHESRQGIREFVAEIVSLGRLRHRNLVQLLGYCRRKGELLLVYEYMPNGSLDRFLYHSDDNPSQLTLNWSQRFHVIKGVASGLLYLHEEWEQVVVHRDIKASNVLLDADMNGRLSDFGLARLHERGGDPRTTHVMGTLGYLAPEHPRTGKATPGTDVYAFGAFLLEVVCGRRPIDVLAPRGEAMLVDMVYRCWRSGVIEMAVDRKLKGKYVEAEAVRVLKLGLLCSNLDPEVRPTMREAVAYLEEVVEMPKLQGLELGPNGVSFGVKHLEAAAPGASKEQGSVLYTSSLNIFTGSSSILESQLSQGR